MTTHLERGWTLGLKSIWDMRAKLAWEATIVRDQDRDRPGVLKTGPRHEPRAFLFASANAIATAWHMVEWLHYQLEKDGLVASASAAVGADLSTVDKVQKWVCLNDAMRTCGAICLAGKHLNLKNKGFAGLDLDVPVFFNFYVEPGSSPSILMTSTAEISTDGGTYTQTLLNVLRDAEIFWDHTLSVTGIPR
ncbi:hypothetical protein [Stenotrophomonas sp. AG209]|uniref:hypothetical protein n=1 Tax=Stenotrophomonas sp. AG209 TaxID=2183909 RepID=UPI000E5A1567|nr:hypothetical protein [Stenotrophomonas sp. AG209]